MNKVYKILMDVFFGILLIVSILTWFGVLNDSKEGTTIATILFFGIVCSNHFSEKVKNYIFGICLVGMIASLFIKNNLYGIFMYFPLIVFWNDWLWKNEHK